MSHHKSWDSTHSRSHDDRWDQQHPESKSSKKTTSVQSTSHQGEQHVLEVQQSKSSKPPYVQSTSYRGEQNVLEYNKSTAEMEEHYKRQVMEASKSSKSPSVQSTCHRCEQNVLEHKKSMTEMEEHYKRKLTEARSALRENEEDFKSFKDRMASNLSDEIKTGTSESMTNPVSQTKLKEMYDDLRVMKWPKIKDHLKSSNHNRKIAEDLMKDMFEAAQEKMEKKKEQIEKMFKFNKHSPGSTQDPKVTIHKQLAVQNLQKALYVSRKQDVVKIPFLKQEEKIPKDYEKYFKQLAAECFWLGSLMALNNPPLQPAWMSRVPGPDAWNMFPESIHASHKDSEPMEQH